MTTKQMDDMTTEHEKSQKEALRHLEAFLLGWGNRIVEIPKLPLLPR
jgi:hypothetical protein